MRRMAFVVATVIVACSCGSTHQVVAPTPLAKVRVLVGVGCPRTTVRDRDVSNPSTGPRQQLLPSAIPTAGLICYFGSEFGNNLVGRQKLDAVQASALAAVVNRIELKSSNGPTSCPIGTGFLNIIFAFSYGTGSDVDLWMHASGCETLDNGYVSGGEGGNPSFYNGFMGAMQRLHDSGPKGMGR